MDRLFINEVEITLSHKHLIRLMEFSGIVTAECKDLKTSSSWSGIIHGLNVKLLAWFIEAPSLLSRYLFVNDISLEVVYIRGLLGGGASASRARLYRENLHAYKTIEDDKLKENQKEIEILGNSVAKGLECGTFEWSTLKTLESISPYECESPVSNLKYVFSTLYLTACWSSSLYLEQRSVLLKIALKSSIVHFLRNERPRHLSAGEKNILIQNLDTVINIINENIKLYPEISTLLSLNLIRELIINQKKIYRWCQKVIKILPDLEYLENGLLKISPVPLINKLNEKFLLLFKIAKKSYLKFAIVLDIYERNALSAGADGIESIEAFFQTQLNQYQQFSKEKLYLLLNLLESFIGKGSISEQFLKNICQKIENFRNHQDWEIREKRARLLRVLRIHESQEISPMYEQRHRETFNFETDEKVKFILTLQLPPLYKKIQRQGVLTNLKYIHFPVFGREEEIQEIHEKLKENNNLTIVGNAYTGKSILAIMFCKKYLNEYDIVWEIDFSRVEHVLSQLAEELGFERSTNIVDRLFENLKTNKIDKKILLFFDSVDNEEAVRIYYSFGNKIKFLITSRNQLWSSVLRMKRFSKLTSVEYISSHLKNETNQSIDELANLLQGSVSGICESTALIKIKYSITQFLVIYQSFLGSNEFLIKLINERLLLLSSETKLLLGIILCCSRIDIPEDILKKIMIMNMGEKSWLKAKGELVNYSLVSVNEFTDFWSINNTVFSIAAQSIKVKRAIEAFLKYLAKDFKIEINIYENGTISSEMQDVLPHVFNVMKTREIKTEDELSILCNLGIALAYSNYKVDIVNYVLKELVDISKNSHRISITNSNRANIYSIIGELFMSKSEFKEAETYFLKRFELERQLSPEHKPSLTAICITLGNFYYKQSDFTKAEHYFLFTTPKTIPELSAINHNLGSLYLSKFDLVRCEAAYLKSLELLKQIYPDRHPALAKIYQDLGNLKFQKAEYAKAEKFYLKSKRISESLNPTNARDLADIYMGLGNAYFAKLDYQKAEKYYQQCNEIRMQVLDENHLDRASISMGLGNLYLIKGEYPTAMLHYTQCRTIRENVLPKAHYDLGIIYMNIGNLYSSMEEFDKAEKFYSACYQILPSTLPANNNHIATMYMNIGNMYLSKSEMNKVEEFFTNCKIIREKNLPKDHTDLAVLYMNIATFYGIQKNSTNAELYYQKSLEILGKNSHQTSPHLATLYMNIASMLCYKSEFKHSLEFNQKFAEIKNSNPKNIYNDDIFYINLGSYFNSIDDYRSAEENYLLCLKIWEKSNYKRKLPRIYLNLAIIYRNKSENEKYQDYLAKYHKMIDDLAEEKHEYKLIVYIV